MVCVSCPIGCRLTVTWNETEPREDTAPVVEGNKCAKGDEYGREEILAPQRVVTATVRLRSKNLSRLPVKTDKPFPKEQIPDLLNELYKLDLRPPVEIGDTVLVLQGFGHAGTRVIATRTVPE
jgi:CxxC motif-containing protein